jgi:hypothetical protein
LLGIFAKVITAITTKVGFVFHAHKASELPLAKATHKVGKSNTLSADQGSNGFFASIAYRADLQAQSVDLSPFIRYDISRIKMKANAMRLSIPILRDLRLNSVLFAPAPLLLPITTLAFVQVSQRSTLRLEVGITLLSPLALST